MTSKITAIEKTAIELIKRPATERELDVHTGKLRDDPEFSEYIAENLFTRILERHDDDYIDDYGAYDAPIAKLADAISEYRQANRKDDNLLADAIGQFHKEFLAMKEFYNRRKSAGRPPMYGEKMKQTAVWLPEDMVDWLKSQPGTMSEVMRDLIKNAMQK